MEASVSSTLAAFSGRPRAALEFLRGQSGFADHTDACSAPAYRGVCTLGECSAASEDRSYSCTDVIVHGEPKSQVSGQGGRLHQQYVSERLRLKHTLGPELQLFNRCAFNTRHSATVERSKLDVKLAEQSLSPPRVVLPVARSGRRIVLQTHFESGRASALLSHALLLPARTPDRP